MSMWSEQATRFEIGILTGSGPEAGIDLWQHILDATRHHLGDSFRGDIDAPSVLVVSDPELGASMRLPDTDTEVRRAIDKHAARLDTECDVWAIACNTLNIYVDHLVAAGRGRHLLSFCGVVEELLADRGGTCVILGARPVASLGPWSPYQRVRDRCVPLDDVALDDLHALIERAKVLGVHHPSLPGSLEAIVSSLDADHIVLACTELPPIAARIDDPRFVDVTQAVAQRLAQHVVHSRIP
jgi:aspartate racemase